MKVKIEIGTIIRNLMEKFKRNPSIDLINLFLFHTIKDDNKIKALLEENVLGHDCDTLKEELTYFNYGKAMYSSSDFDKILISFSIYPPKILEPKYRFFFDSGNFDTSGNRLISSIDEMKKWLKLNNEDLISLLTIIYKNRKNFLENKLLLDYSHSKNRLIQNDKSKIIKYILTNKDLSILREYLIQILSHLYNTMNKEVSFTPEYIYEGKLKIEFLELRLLLVNGVYGFTLDALTIKNLLGKFKTQSPYPYKIITSKDVLKYGTKNLNEIITKMSYEK